MLRVKEVPPAASVHASPHLLISSRDAAALNHLQTLSLRLPGLQVTTRLVSNGHADPLHGVERLPDLLLLRVSHLWREELAALLQRPAHERPPLLICGPLEEREGIRLAMQAGARDFLPEPVAAEELLATLGRMIRESRVGPAPGGTLIAVLSAKGGSGATLLACNLAHQLSAQGERTLLLDLDLQFGNVTHCLDLTPAHSQVEVLRQIDTLDSVALRGFCSPFSPTLHVLGGRPGELCLPQDVPLEQLDALLQLARSSYDWVVMDVPRQIDHLTGIALEQADRIYLLTQQSLGHLKDASRMVRILRDDLGVPGDRLRVVVNRYDKAAPVGLKDIGDALRCTELRRLPNDYAQVSGSQNAGVPLELHAPRAAVTLAMRELGQELLGTEAVGQSVLKRTFGRLFRG